MGLIRQAGLALIAIAACAAASADSAVQHPASCSKASALQPSLCRLSLPRISHIRIEQNAAVSPAASSNADCGGFKLTLPAVRRYFASARQLRDGSAAAQTLDWLPCQSTGTVSFVDGRKARWRIEQAQTATLAFDQGEELFLYCPRCKFGPFKW